MTSHAHKNRFTADGAAYFGPRREEDKADIGEAITMLLDEALVSHRKAEYEKTRGSGEGDVAKKRIGAGYIGLACDRALAFRYHKWPKEDRPSTVSKGELQRHAEVGFWTEDKTAEWLKMAGFDLRTHKVDEDGNPKLDPWGKPQQFGYKSAWDQTTKQARIAGEIDGVILSVPSLVKAHFPILPCNWESKKATDKKFKKFKKETVKGADPVYYAQVQIGMAFLEIKATLFSMLNCDSMEYYFEMIPFDQQYAQRIYDRAIDVLQSETPFQFNRISKDKSDFRCRFCDFKDACWEQEQQTSNKVEKPNWL